MGPGASLKSIDWSKVELEKFEKHFFYEHANVTTWPLEEVEEWRRQNQMVVSGNNVPKPVRTFAEAGLPDYILQAVQAAGFTNPTPIQSQGWTMALTGRDVVGIAQTGS